jgi:NitT/TauT family transport system substrate-binding protein
MLDSPNFTRRKLLGASAATGLAGAGAFLSMSALAQDKVKVNMQLGWIAGGNQIGEVVAKQLGYYATEGIDFAIQPGGPSIDGVAIVASGRWEVGQVSSSPSNMLAVSQDLPIKVFATGLQQHPYTFFSLKKNPIRSPKDMVGKKIGIQSTGLVLLRALLAKNKIDEKSMTDHPDRRRHDTAADRAGRHRDRLADQHHGPEAAGRRPRRPAAVGLRCAPVRAALLRHQRDDHAPP